MQMRQHFIKVMNNPDCLHLRKASAICYIRIEVVDIGFWEEIENMLDFLLNYWEKELRMVRKGLIKLCTYNYD